MTSEEIIKELDKSRKIVGETFENDVTINFEFIPYNWLGLLDIDFVNCKFKKGFYIKNLPNEGIRKIRFSYCEFESELKIYNLNVNTLKIENCNFSRDITVTKVQSIKSDFTFEDCNVSGFVDFLDISCQSMRIKNNHVRDFFLSEIEASHIKISSLVKDINLMIISNIQNTQYVSIENNNRIKELRVNNSQNIDLKGNFNNIQIENAQIQSLNLCGELKGQFHIGTIQKIDFKSSVFSQNFSLSDYYIDEVNLDDISSVNGFFSFRNVTIKDFKLNSIKVSKFYMDIVEFKDQLIIKNCDLSGLKPNNVKWLKNQVISPDNTNYKIPWFYRFRIKKIHNETLITELKQQRDAYRQLKVASQNNQNQIEALTFYRNEMRLYWKEIRLVGGEKWYNTVLIFLNRIISDFGQNWFYPLLFLFGIQFILFFSIFNWSFSFNLKDIEYGLGQYFRLLNPVRTTPDYINTGFGVFTDFWMRVLNGFFIYHFLKASRKYGKGE